MASESAPVETAAAMTSADQPKITLYWYEDVANNAIRGVIR
jgi:hypothetical protein